MQEVQHAATKGELQSHEAGNDQRFGGLDQDIKLLNERIDKIEKTRAAEPAATASETEEATPYVHEHVAPGHGSGSSEIVTGPPHVAAASEEAPATAATDNW